MRERKHQRLSFEGKVDLTYESPPATASGFTTNIARGGFFVAISVQRDIGTALAFTLKDETGVVVLQGRGQIVWTRAHDEGADRPAGMAVRFLELDRASRQRITEVLGEASTSTSTPEELSAEELCDSTAVLLAEVGIGEGRLGGPAIKRTGASSPSPLPPPAMDPALDEAPTAHTPIVQAAEPLAIETKNDTGGKLSVRAGLKAPPDKPRRRIRVLALFHWLIFCVVLVITVGVVMTVVRNWGDLIVGFFPARSDSSTAADSPVDAPTGPAQPSQALAPTPTPPPASTPHPSPRAVSPPRRTTPRPTAPPRRATTSRPPSALTQLHIQVEEGQTTITGLMNGRPSARQIRHFYMDTPPRLVLLIKGITEQYPAHRLIPDSPHLVGVRLGLHTETSPPELTVAFDLSSPDVRMHDFEIRPDGFSFSLRQ